MLNTIRTYLESKCVNIMFSAFWIYNYLFVIFEDKLKPFGFLKKFFVRDNKMVEPDLATWNYIGTINSGRLIEQYRYSSEAELKDWFLGSELDAHFIRKCEKYRISRIRLPESKWFHEFPNANNTRFLNIMYSHKDMKEPLKLKLDLAYVRNGNEVFSKGFVYRMLTYQYNPSDYVFDDAYELYLMDDKIKKHTLTSSQYIYFDDRMKTGYEVRKI